MGRTQSSQASRRSSQSGFGHILAVVLVLAVFAVVGFIGYSLYGHSKGAVDTTASVTTTSKTAASDVTSVPQINTSSDLDKASTSLEQLDPSSANASDTSTLDKEMAAF